MVSKIKMLLCFDTEDKDNLADGVISKIVITIIIIIIISIV